MSQPRVADPTPSPYRKSSKISRPYNEAALHAYFNDACAQLQGFEARKDVIGDGKKIAGSTMSGPRGQKNNTHPKQIIVSPSRPSFRKEGVQALMTNPPLTAQIVGDCVQVLEHCDLWEIERKIIQLLSETCTFDETNELVLGACLKRTKVQEPVNT